MARFSLREKAAIIRTLLRHRPFPITRPTAEALLGVSLLLIATNGMAQSDGSANGSGFAEQCPSPTFVYTPGAAVVQRIPIADAPVEALADSVLSEDGIVTLEGNTSITYQGRTISAENALYNPETGEVIIDGELSFESDGVRLESNDAEIELGNSQFKTGESVYEIDLNGRRITGRASSMERRDDGSFVLRNATYSSCPKFDNSWFLKANRIELYPNDGLGIAKNIVLRFKGVPILAFPVFTFPISPARKTGFLAPVLGRGENTGFELQLPFYWNIRPNIDATITPRILSERGLQVQTEFRYLNTQGSWILDNEVLQDRDFDNNRRRFTQLRHNGQFGPAWSSSISASDVSDSDYFEDLGNSLQVASITHLERRADLVYDWDDTQVELRLQSFQTVDSSTPDVERPYRRLPQIKFSTIGGRRPFGLLTTFDGEAVLFDRDSSVTGLRIDALPKLSLPIVKSAWFFTPSISQRFTTYNLNSTEPGQPSNQSRNLTTLSVDSGLFFDRLLDDGSVLTLEPRLFYLNVPFEDQSDIPVFDSSEFDFSIAQLFRENRFSGADRIADANQLSLGLTSRLVDGATGREMVRGSIGQIFFFEDRQVSLGDDEPETRDTSDFVGEIAAEITNDWNIKGNIQWNPDDTNTVRSSLLLSYRPSPDKIINLAHRNVDIQNSADTEQLDFSILWPIGEQWRIAGRWNFSLAADTSIESLVGLEYNSCCWAFRFAARRFISEDGLDHDTALLLQLVLKGLAPLGQNYGKLLEFSILGYEDDIK